MLQDAGVVQKWLKDSFDEIGRCDRKTLFFAKKSFLKWIFFRKRTELGRGKSVGSETLEMKDMVSAFLTWYREKLLYYFLPKKIRQSAYTVHLFQVSFPYSCAFGVPLGRCSREEEGKKLSGFRTRLGKWREGLTITKLTRARLDKI